VCLMCLICLMCVCVCFSHIPFHEFKIFKFK
jgi:hypothetical protein